MSTAISDGSLVTEEISVLEEGFSFANVENGKANYWCAHCPYHVQSTTKAAIKRHITTKHACLIPLPKSGTKKHVSVDEGGDVGEGDKGGTKTIVIAVAMTIPSTVVLHRRTVEITCHSRQRSHTTML